ncbi:low affinity iron permease family protein [Jiangella rhizosphaerae]|uniref:low affinity iron permease family protein n=1 Tax=Jiangella rhizosphaerae TaxID=2293569 RepID=UPI0038991929
MATTTGQGRRSRGAALGDPRNDDGEGAAASEQASWHGRLSAAARAVVDFAGSAAAAVLAAVLVAAWLVVAVVEGFTQAWLNVLFGVTGAVTFVMVFFIQHVSARELRAVMLKLDELVQATDGADDDVVHAGHGSLDEQERIEERQRRARRAAEPRRHPLSRGSTASP